MTASSIPIDATVKLISTDDQTFTFHLYHLLSARSAARISRHGAADPRSAVFRDLLPSEPTSIEIHFTDPLIEDGPTLRLFHAYIYCEIIPSAETVPLLGLDRLFGFLRKYECKPMIRNLLLDLRSYLPRDPDEPVAPHTATPVEVFTLAASLGSTPTCTEILGACPAGKEQEWECLDTRVMPAETFERLPPRFAWGLMRSMDRRQPMDSAEMWQKASRVFRALMMGEKLERGGFGFGKYEDTAAARVKARSDRKQKVASCPYPK